MIRPSRRSKDLAAQPARAVRRTRPEYGEAAAAAFRKSRSFSPDDLRSEAAALAAFDLSGDGLDVGCGTGNYLAVLERLRREGAPLGRLFGLDPSAAMLAGAGPALAGRLAAARAETLPVRDGAVDFLLYSHSFHLIADPRAAAAEAARVLAPHGRLLLLTHFPDRNPRLSLYRYLPEALAIDRARMGDRERYRRLFEADFLLERAADWERARDWERAALAEALRGGYASTLELIPEERKAQAAAAVLAAPEAVIREVPRFTGLLFRKR